MKHKLARLIEVERLIRQHQAEKYRLIADLNIDEHAAVDIGLALQLSPANAQDEVDWATRVETLFPNVFDALAAGVISERSAHAVVDPTEFYPDDVAQRGVADSLATAEGRTCQQLRRSIRGRLQRADPAVHAEKREAARRNRKVVIYDEEDSMTTIACS